MVAQSTTGEAVGRKRGSLVEALAFSFVLAVMVVGFFHESLLGGKVLSPADVLFVEASFREVKGPDYEPLNRLLIDPVLQFQPWIELNRHEIRAGRLPLWNPFVGCGAPHLANGQSAVFDPFHAIAYLGRLPDAHAWMAAARLWVAGLGMFVLAGHWGLTRWGRWFAGLVYPFSGFLVVWLLYPVTSVAVWFPWVIWASDRVLDRVTLARVGGMALVVGFCLLGGHVQTSSHVLLAMGLNLIWRWRGAGWRKVLGWIAGLALGIGIAAIEIVALADYLTKSPVWSDRAGDRKPPWTLVRPRLLDAACTALPYAFGSQRRGHPNLARALGVHNLNESAGGFAGLGTLIWLAPLAFATGRRNSRVRWLVGLTGFALLAAYRWFPADNLLRAIPVLNVTDNRRLTLWVAFGLSLLGGIGLDHLGAVRRGAWWGRWAAIGIGLAIVCAVVSLGVGHFESKIRLRAIQHYATAASETAGADPMTYRGRAERQTRDTIQFVRRYYGLAALHLGVLSATFLLVRQRRLAGRFVRPGLVALTLVDLFGFGIGLNPAIDREDDRPVTSLIQALRAIAPAPLRVLGLGEELPPNVCMRYGLSDIRNYDSIEMASSLAFFATLYPSGGKERTSRREVTWERAILARDSLREAGVAAIVGATPPPDGAFSRVMKVGEVWVACPDLGSIADAPFSQPRPGLIHVDREKYDRNLDHGKMKVCETWDEGWSSDGANVTAGPPFLEVRPIPGQAEITLRYAPRLVFLAGILSIFCVLATVFALTRFTLLPSTRYVLWRLGRTQAVGLEWDSP
jgi:hypothetical protein